MNINVDGLANALVNGLVNVSENQLRMSLLVHTIDDDAAQVEMIIDFDLEFISIKVHGDVPLPVAHEIRKRLRSPVSALFFSQCPSGMFREYLSN